MIQIYAPENTDFEMNGNDVLTPSVCTMEAELGGAWILNMTHPIDDEGKWKNIVKEAVISAPTFMGKKQLFRIDESDKRDTEVVVKAYPIFFDSADEVFILDKRPTDKTGLEALDILTEGTKYSGTSDIATVNTAYFIRRNLMDCLNGDSPSFIGTWGGEVLYDNYNVIVCKRAGANKGAEVRYGKNMNGISFKEDMSQVVTRIVPVAYNGRTLTTNYVDSTLINNYAKVYTKEIKFEDVRYIEDLSENEDTSSIIVCNNQEELDAALIAKCNEQFAAGIDIFKVTIQIDMIALENTEEYKEFADIVKIGLGDTVSCYNKRLNIAAEARAIKIKWNCITDSVEEVTLGDYETDFLEQWNSTISKVSKVLDDDGNIMAERVAGVLNAISTQLRYQKTLAQKQDVRAILFEDLDPDSQLYGAMCLGTQGLQIANKRLPDDSDWDWTTAFTANGGYADVIMAGILSDKEGKNWWNLNDGELSITKGKIKVSGSVRKYASDYTEEDLSIANEYTIGLREITQEALEKYDIDGDGEITVLDVLKINKMLTGEVEYYDIDTSIEINPLSSQQILKTLGVSVGANGLFSNTISAQKVKFDKCEVYSPYYNGYARGETGELYVAGKHIRFDNGILTRFLGSDGSMYTEYGDWKYCQLDEDRVYEVLYKKQLSISEYSSGDFYSTGVQITWPFAVSEILNYSATIQSEYVNSFFDAHLCVSDSSAFTVGICTDNADELNPILYFKAIIKVA